MHDFNSLLHELRSRELARVPGGARVVLSGGCAGSWYFEWFADNYPTPVERHLGVELHEPRPDDLPDDIEWLDRSLDDLKPVIDGEVDLVFAGQVLEHLWRDEVAGFLLEAHRVLRPGGRLVLDSPNRRVTSALGWTQPEHTVEFTVSEARELLTLAGFDQIEIRGIWLSWDDESGRPLPLEPDPADETLTFERRRDKAESQPEDSFVWWAEAERTQAKPDNEALHRRLQEIFARERPRYLNRLRNEVGVVSERGNGRVVAAAVGEAGYLIRGPGVAMPAGEWRVSFSLGLDPTDGGDVRATDVLGSIEVATAEDGAIALRHLTVQDVGPGGALRALALPFSLDSTAYGTEFRMRSTGRAGLHAQLQVALEEGKAEADEVDVGGQEEISHQPAATETHPPTENPQTPPPSSSQGSVRRIGRALLWPFRRFFDPRFEGLAQHVAVTRDDLARRIDVARAEVVGADDRRHAQTTAELAELRGAVAELRSALAELRNLVESDMDAATEAATTTGRALADLIEGVSNVQVGARDIQGSKPRLDLLARGDVDDLDPRIAAVLNRETTTEGFAAQQGFFFNPPIWIGYEGRDVFIRSVNERIAEVPYIFRALASVSSGSSLLDVGATESTVALSLAALGYRVTALDPRPYPLSHPNLHIVTAPLESWETDDTFAAVLCLSTIEHVGLTAYGLEPGAPDADLAAIRRIRELVEPQGLLVLTTPFGRAKVDDFQRIYDRARLDELLEGWIVEDLTVVRREDATTWAPAGGKAAGQVEQVALVTARRPA